MSKHENKLKQSITLEPQHKRAIAKIVAARILASGKSVSFSTVLNELLAKGLKCKN